MRLAAFDLDGTIYENAELLPETRAAIGRLHDSGIEPLVIEYLKTPPTREQIAPIVDEQAIVELYSR